MSTEPQANIYCTVDSRGDLTTKSAAGRWAFKTLHHALSRASQDRIRDWSLTGNSGVRVARYKFDGWAD